MLCVSSSKAQNRNRAERALTTKEAAVVSTAAANETRSEIGFCLQIGTLLSATRFFGVWHGGWYMPKCVDIVLVISMNVVLSVLSAWINLKGNVCGWME